MGTILCIGLQVSGLPCAVMMAAHQMMSLQYVNGPSVSSGSPGFRSFLIRLCTSLEAMYGW